jgi:hypothetical protein
MKKTFAIILAAASLAACAREDLSIIVEEPEVQTYTMSVVANKGENPDDDIATRALSLSGSTLNATWSQGDAVEVWTSDGTTTKYGTLTAETSGASTKLKGTLSSLPSNGQSLLLKYLSPAYATQDGTLTGSETSIDRVCDYATATVTATVAGSNVTATDASFVNQQAIVKFTLKDKDDASALSVNKLFVTVGGTTCEVTPAAAMSELYVAVPAVASGRVTLTAQKTSLGFTFYYDYLKTGATFAQGQYYAINASLTLVKNINVATTASLGRVVAADGMMYACVESATNAGTTAIAVITERSYASIYGAIAISEESWGMNWSDAKSACEGKTPKLDGANWRFPTVDQWKSMCAANGGNEYNYTGLDALITKAGGSPLRTDWFYWTSSPDEANSNYKYHVSFNGNGSLYFSNGQDQSNKVYVRAFLYFVGN